MFTITNKSSDKQKFIEASLSFISSSTCEEELENAFRGEINNRNETIEYFDNGYLLSAAVKPKQHLVENEGFVCSKPWEELVREALILLLPINYNGSFGIQALTATADRLFRYSSASFGSFFETGLSFMKTMFTGNTFDSILYDQQYNSIVLWQLLYSRTAEVGTMSLCVPSNRFMCFADIVFSGSWLQVYAASGTPVISMSRFVCIMRSFDVCHSNEFYSKYRSTIKISYF